MGNSVASIQYIASILKKKKLCLDTSPLTNGYNKAERVWNVAKLKFTIKDNIPRNTTPLVPSLDVLLDVFYKAFITNWTPLKKRGCPYLFIKYISFHQLSLSIDMPLLIALIIELI